MKKAWFFVISLAIVVFLGSCDLLFTLQASDIFGEWDFRQTTTIKDVQVSNVHLSVMGDEEAGTIAMLDIGWDVDDETNPTRWHGVGGSLHGKTFTGTYHACYLDDTEYNIEVTFSHNNGEIGIACKGEGPLDGVTLEHGTRAMM